VDDTRISLHAATRYLHVANGTSVTRTLETAGVSGIKSIWADPLHEGPVPAGLNDDELLEVRRQYLAAPFGRSTATGDDPSRDPVNDMRQWRAAIARHDWYDELVLWFEHDLFDQLNLIQLLTWIREHVPPATRVSLVCIDSFPGRPDFKGLGELTPGELASLLDVRQPVTDDHYTQARVAWLAFREPTPEALDALQHEHTLALPYLAPAITRFLQEYPWTGDGLSRTERRLLALAADGTIPLSTVFPRMGEGDRFYTITDLALFATVDALATTSPPLLRVDVSQASEHPFRRVVSATDSGRSALAGRLDRVAASGIDRWLGGVHLQGRSAPWRWDDTRRSVVRV
jgi:hypothetical protein